MDGEQIEVIGAGLAGCAAALAAAARGIAVTLHEQRPAVSTDIHHTAVPAELTGTADLGVPDTDRATGLLKAELRVLCPPAMECADQTRTGETTLAVDRAGFTCALTDRVEAADRIELRRGEVRALPDGPVVIATGPATWSPLARAIHRAARSPFQFSFIGRPPLIAADTIDLSDATEEPPYPGAEPAVFLPITEREADEMTRRLAEVEPARLPGLGPDTLLAEESDPAERLAADPEEGLRRMLRGPRGPQAQAERPALCLTPDDADRTAFHLAGMLTALPEDAQEHALQAVDAMAGVQILRPATVHRTPWLAGDEALLASLQLRRRPKALLAGTITGAYGYVEALVLGAVAGIAAARMAGGSEPLPPPQECLSGALCWALAEHRPHEDGRMLQANFGMIPELSGGQALEKAERRERQAERALEAVERYANAD